MQQKSLRGDIHSRDSTLLEEFSLFQSAVLLNIECGMQQKNHFRTFISFFKDVLNVPGGFGALERCADKYSFGVAVHLRNMPGGEATSISPVIAVTNS